MEQERPSIESSIEPLSPNQVEQDAEVVRVEVIEKDKVTEIETTPEAILQKQLIEEIGEILLEPSQDYQSIKRFHPSRVAREEMVRAPKGVLGRVVEFVKKTAKKAQIATAIFADWWSPLQKEAMQIWDKVLKQFLNNYLLRATRLIDESGLVQMDENLSFSCQWQNEKGENLEFIRKLAGRDDVGRPFFNYLLKKKGTNDEGGTIELDFSQCYPPGKQLLENLQMRGQYKFNGLPEIKFEYPSRTAALLTQVLAREILQQVVKEIQAGHSEASKNPHHFLQYLLFKDSKFYRDRRKRKEGEPLNIVYLASGKDTTPSKVFYDDNLWYVDIDKKAIEEVKKAGLPRCHQAVVQSALDFRLPEEKKADLVILRNPPPKDSEGVAGLENWLEILDTGACVILSHWGSHYDARLLAESDKFELAGVYGLDEKQDCWWLISDKKLLDKIKQELLEDAKKELIGHQVDKYASYTFIFEREHPGL